MGKVLIIDDNKKNVELMRDFIESWGYDAIVAYQGMKALEMAREELPDIILLDVMLPGMSGFEVCQALKDKVDTKDIPVVMVTALATPEDRSAGFATGADYFMVKPVSYKELKAVLKNLMQKKERIDAMENRGIVLEKINLLLRHFLHSSYDVHEKERLDFYRNVFKHLGLQTREVEKILSVLLFQPIYQDVKNAAEKLQFIIKVFQGLKCDVWIRDLIVFSCTVPEERDPGRTQYLEEQGLLEVAQLCYELHRFDDILKESAFDTNKALSLFKEEQKQFDYSSMLVDALTKELNDQDLRNRIRQDFNVTSHVL